MWFYLFILHMTGITANCLQVDFIYTSCSGSGIVSINAVFGLEATESNLLHLSVSSSVITSEAGTKPGGGRDFCCHIATKWILDLIFDQRRGNS